jgi:Gdp/GTP exchange factor required for growth at low temperatures
MRRFWNRVGMWETRMLNDLRIYTSNVDDFLYIHRAINSIVDAKPLDVSSRAASITSVGGTDFKGKVHSDSKISPPSACIPFIGWFHISNFHVLMFFPGVYLSQLHRHGQLSDLIDSTAPSHAVGIDPITSNFDAPAHPEVFSSLVPLPPSMQLELLIDMHKQRLIAGVIKSLVAGQHLASRVEFPVDKKTFQKCLKLRALDTDTLGRALSVYPE